jgi:response regulator RpfG family c-di-GMP phosphodiesterase
MELEHAWQIEVAALLSQIGCVAIPESILRQAYSGNTLTPDEFRLFIRHSQTGSEMIANIPRLEPVASIIFYQEKNFNGTGFPEDDVAGEAIPFGSRLIKIASDYDVILQSGREVSQVISVIKARIGSGWYDPIIADNFIKVLSVQKKYRKKNVLIKQLDDSMIISEDISSKDTTVIVAHKGQLVTKALRMTLLNFHNGGHISKQFL